MRKKEEKDDTFFGGFEAIVDGLARIERVKPSSDLGGPDGGFETITEIGNDIDEMPMTEPEEITGVPEVKKEDVIEEEIEEEVDEIESSISTDEVSDLGEYEHDVVDFFTDKFTNELGWEVEDDKKPKTVSEVIDYLKGVIEENSRPQYASEEIERLNEYVANGGDLRSFYSDSFGQTNLDTIDISNENAQRKILTDNFTRLGYTKEKIDRFISRYEDSGTMQEEAEDALEVLKDSYQKKSEQLLIDQEKLRKEQVQQQQKFYTNVYNSIEKTDSIRGIPISAKEKKELNDYIFKPEADGLTKYQKDYAKDYKNLIESAYFTMKGDSLIQKVTQKATSQAAKNLQDKLANKGKRVKNSGVTHGGQGNTLGAWDTVSRQLRRPNF